MKGLRHKLLIIPLVLVCFSFLFPDRVLAAEAGGDKWGILLTLGRFFNLALVVGIVGWLARKPLAEFFVTRTQSIHEQITEAEKVHRESEAKLAEIQSRMSHLDEELKALKELAEKEAQAEY